MQLLSSGAVGTWASVSLAGLLVGCAPNVEPVPRCCYIGDVTLAKVEQLYFATDEGSRLGFEDVFEGFAPQMSVATRPLPFREARIAAVVQPSLPAVLPRYDANANGVIEEPELTVLYLQEGGVGLGHDIDHVGVDSPVRALVLPRVELGGLMLYVARRERDMQPATQRIFRDLQRLGRDIRTRGSQGADRRDCRRPTC